MFMEKAGMIARLGGAIRLAPSTSGKLRKCIWTIPTLLMNPATRA